MRTMRAQRSDHINDLPFSQPNVLSFRSLYIHIYDIISGVSMHNLFIIMGWPLYSLHGDIRSASTSARAVHTIAEPYVCINDDNHD